jgi:hypothetical protein
MSHSRIEQEYSITLGFLLNKEKLSKKFQKTDMGNILLSQENLSANLITETKGTS